MGYCLSFLMLIFCECICITERVYQGVGRRQKRLEKHRSMLKPFNSN